MSLVFIALFFGVRLTSICSRAQNTIFDKKELQHGQLFLWPYFFPVRFILLQEESLTSISPMTGIENLNLNLNFKFHLYAAFLLWL
jgi:hypothetical protein